ncbi:winged helix-turn-helix transcriptional regulator [Aurantimonas endophytica]|uniref:DNA-binding HxlR family transcriptional regulator n=1 Tax=Aurantimonas endophytica TaxID=1522175 RepID=A0A7W6MRV2_9HYPH|nr:winged helix-turn-helix transcriptional regulator [Aurantimonas endophytica]MBB4005374.1 DNA-binding HxlR family transcriptional regulator [Aurantimonas endophytica]MCO6405965.1 transcriptional regulator [Aurantimonas endophytica]
MSDQLAGQDQCAERLRAAIRCIDGKWKLPILASLHRNGTLRFSELERAIPGVTQKMLTQHLRELEEDGIVHRIVHSQVPPKVEYLLTGKGLALQPVFASLHDWVG